MNSKQYAQSKRDNLFNEPTSLSVRKETLRFIEWATLAPSTHNTQPWVFDVSEDGVITVSIDKEKAVAMADPDFRDMFISAGALMRHIEIIGAELGSISNLTIEPNLTTGKVAKFTLSSSNKWEDFLNSQQAKSISTRQNYRGKYLEKSINPGKVEDLANKAIDVTKSKSKVSFHVYDINSKQAQELSQLITQGIADAYKISEFRTEVANHINNNFSKKETGLHGYSLTMNSFLSVVLPTIMRKKDIGGKLSELNREGILGSQGIVVVSTENDTPVDWVEAGRAMTELILKLNSKGIQTSIYAAAIEMGDLRGSVNKVISEKGQQAQLMFTYGYPGREIGFSHRQSPASVTTFR